MDKDSDACKSHLDTKVDVEHYEIEYDGDRRLYSVVLCLARTIFFKSTCTALGTYISI